ncbi:MAG TPA: hypothetical protein VMU73_01430, partial [Gaiellaceae bacterium]|nr:hypothetical protein [Gaiellaceae bacterium]
MSNDDLQERLADMGNELLDRYEELSLLYALGEAFATVLDVDQICDVAVAKAAETIGAGKAIVALTDAHGALYAAAVRGTDRLSAGGITEYVARTGRQLLLHQGEAPPDGAS